MKKVINFVIIALMLQILVLKESSAQNPTPCLTDMTQAPVDTIPNYLKSWWDAPSRNGYIAIVYVDFPDGRTPQGDQPITNQQLATVPNKEAAGEVGIIHNGSVFTTEASKYDWNNRWDMYFTNDGSYTGSAHPDYDINSNNIAYGSMKEYWSEVSNNVFNMVPYETHPNETDPKLKSGIINDYINVSGTKIIEMITLPKKKFGTAGVDSYFTDYYDVTNLVSGGVAMINDTYDAIQSQTSFDLVEFKNNGGVLLIVFAGSMESFKGIGTWRSGLPITVTRGRRGALTTLQNSRTEGFGIAAHEYGHLQFGWDHTVSGRCDIMNVWEVHDPDSPQHPNPIFKMEQNWVTPVYYDNTTSVDDLPPIETANECAVITIYGKPGATPDGLGGECLVVENRRQIGFDRKISEFNDPSDFHGGLAVWHFVPQQWTQFPPNTCSSGDERIKFMAANGDSTQLCGSTLLYKLDKLYNLINFPLFFP